MSQAVEWVKLRLGSLVIKVRNGRDVWACVVVTVKCETIARGAALAARGWSSIAGQQCA
jgi:hypothetical protein